MGKEFIKPPAGELPVPPAGRRRNAADRRRLMASFLSPADTAIRGNRAEGCERWFPAREIAAPIGPLAVRRLVHRRRPQKPGSLVLIEAGEGKPRKTGNWFQKRKWVETTISFRKQSFETFQGFAIRRGFQQCYKTHPLQDNHCRVFGRRMHAAERWVVRWSIMSRENAFNAEEAQDLLAALESRGASKCPACQHSGRRFKTSNYVSLPLHQGFVVRS